MNMQEMATAVAEHSPVIICLLNNQYLGMVRQMQQLFYGKRYEATCLRRRITCPLDCKEITGTSGFPILAPTAAGKPNPMVPSPPEVINCFFPPNSRYWLAHI